MPPSKRKKKKITGGDHRIIVQNRKARHNYEIEEKLEAGIVLQGSEVKSLRSGNANINEAYGYEKNGEIFLRNSYIGEYKGASFFKHEPRRLRKLLLNAREIKKLIGKIKEKGLTLVPLSLYFNKKNKVKVELAVAKGKKSYDKRESEKQRDWKREKQRLLKNN